MPVTALRPATEPPQRSPERQSLAAAIDRLRSAEDYLVSVRAAADIQLDREFAAGHAVDAAQAALVGSEGRLQSLARFCVTGCRRFRVSRRGGGARPGGCGCRSR